MYFPFGDAINGAILGIPIEEIEPFRQEILRGINEKKGECTNMKCYSEVTFLEYQKKKREMFDNLGRTSGKCNDVACPACPLDEKKTGVNCNAIERLNPEKALKIVMEYEPKVDWTKVPVDTKILVSLDGKTWHKRYFCKFKNGGVYAFDNGATSFTNNGSTKWEYAKLYKEGE